MSSQPPVPSGDLPPPPPPPPPPLPSGVGMIPPPLPPPPIPPPAVLPHPPHVPAPIMTPTVVVPQPRVFFQAATIVLLHVPDVLLSARALRDLMYPCGACRNISMSNENKIAVIKMSSPKGALIFYRHWKVVAKKVDSPIQCFLIHNTMNNATNKTVDLPLSFEQQEPPDESFVQKLAETFTAVKHAATVLSEQQQQQQQSSANTTQPLPETPQDETNETNETNEDPSHNQNDEQEKEDNNDDTGNDGNHEKKKLDVSKVAAAAGGGVYDEEADPLNAPEVLKAVAKFKKKLELLEQQQKKKRKEIVDSRLKKEIAKAKEERKKQQLEMQKAQKLKEKEEKQREEANKETDNEKNVVDTGVRGVSNLPSWMTKGKTDHVTDEASSTVDESQEKEEDVPLRKRKFFPSEANRDINVRKQRLDMGDGMSIQEIRAANEAADQKFATTKEEILATSFPLLLPQIAEEIKSFVISKIVDYLGEEETTMIDFVMKHLQQKSGRTVSALFEEMKIVLEEDAEAFVTDLYKEIIKVSAQKKSP